MTLLADTPRTVDQIDIGAFKKRILISGNVNETYRNVTITTVRVV